MLIEETLFGTVNKVKVAIARLKLHEPKEGYYVAFSGGKDSIVVKDLVLRAGVKCDIHHNITTVEPPELIYYIRQHHPDVINDLPKETMWELIEKNGTPPTRLMRYCCRTQKEIGGEGRVCVTGIRHEESVNRSGRQIVETCKNRNGKKFLHPIIDWTESEVWEYIETCKLPYCKLYDEGHSRIGCVMCPFSGQKGMQRDAQLWPKIANMYRFACEKAYQKRLKQGKDMKNWSSGDDMYNWWLTGKAPEKEVVGQTAIYGLMADESIT